MRGLLRYHTAKLLLELAETVRSDGNMSLEFISDEHHLLDVSGEPLLLNLIPFLLLRIGTALVKEHPAYSDEDQDVYPGYIKSELHGFSPARCIVLFCHSLF